MPIRVALATGLVLVAVVALLRIRGMHSVPEGDGWRPLEGPEFPVTSVLLVGAGATGTRATRQLVDTDGVEVLLADHDRERADQVADSMGDGVRAVRWTVDQPIPSGVGVVLCALPAGADVPVIERALAAGLPAATCSDDERGCEAVLALDAPARAAGITLGVGCGFAPGLSDLLVLHAAGHLDTVREVHIAEYGVAGPACAFQRHQAARTPVHEWRDGAWVTKGPGSARQLVWFPEPVGSADCYRVASGAAPVLVRSFPSLERITVRAAARRRDRLLARFPMWIRPGSEGGWGGLHVEVRGDRGPTREIQVLGLADRMSVATGTVLACTGLVLTGDLPVGSGPDGGVSPGVHGLAGLVESVPFLTELADRGVRAAVYEGDRALA